MTTNNHDFEHNHTLGKSVAGGAHPTTTTGSGIDLQNCDGYNSFAIAVVESITDGVHTLAVQESNNDNTADTKDQQAADPYAAVTPAIARVLTAGIVVVNFRRTKRFARVVVTPAGATTGANYSVTVGAQKKFF